MCKKRLATDALDTRLSSARKHNVLLVVCAQAAAEAASVSEEIVVDDDEDASDSGLDLSNCQLEVAPETRQLLSTTGKHPISLLQEFTQRQKMDPPSYQYSSSANQNQLVRSVVKKCFLFLLLRPTVSGFASSSVSETTNLFRDVVRIRKRHVPMLL